MKSMGIITTSIIALLVLATAHADSDKAVELQYRVIQKKKSFFTKVGESSYQLNRMIVTSGIGDVLRVQKQKNSIPVLAEVDVESDSIIYEFKSGVLIIHNNAGQGGAVALPAQAVRTEGKEMPSLVASGSAYIKAFRSYLFTAGYAPMGRMGIQPSQLKRSNITLNSTNIECSFSSDYNQLECYQEVFMEVVVSIMPPADYEAEDPLTYL